MRLSEIISTPLIPIIIVFTACSSSAPTTSTPTQQIPTPLKSTSISTSTPTPSPTQQSNALPLQITSVTTPVSQGAEATLIAQTEPKAECNISVYYKSGKSTASGLFPKTADSSGRVSWTWKVGTKTTPGSWKIIVTASFGGKTVSQTTYFEVR